MAFKPFFKRGRDPRIEEIEDSTFETLASENDKQVKDLTFDPELTAASFTAQNKNAASFTAQNKS